MMSAEFNKRKVCTGASVPGSVIGGRTQESHPRNCAHECPYGRGRDFCFPCYAKILKEMRENKKAASEA